MKKELSNAKFGSMMAKLVLPDGFTGEMKTEPKWGNTGGWLKYVVYNGDIRIEFSQMGDGSTNFLMADGKWHTFDLRGVSASFYFMNWEGKPEGNLNTILKEEIKKVEDALRYEKTAIKLPGTSFTMQPKDLERYHKQLTSGRDISFMPGGFGTGLVFSTKRSCQNRPATAEQTRFFGVSQLYVEMLECD